VAQRDEAARQLAHTVAKAPFAGIVTNVPSIAAGKYLQASVTAFYLVAAGFGGPQTTEQRRKSAIFPPIVRLRKAHREGRAPYSASSHRVYG
jgi:hypothetical protein